MLLGYLLLWHLRLFICKLSALHGTVLNTPSTQSSRCLFLLLSSPVCALFEVVVSVGGEQPGDLHRVPGAVQMRILILPLKVSGPGVRWDPAGVDLAAQSACVTPHVPVLGRLRPRLSLTFIIFYRGSQFS